MRSEIPETSCHIEDLDYQLSHTQEVYHDLVIFPIGQTLCRTDDIVAPECERETPRRRKRRETPRSQGKKHLCRNQFQQEEICFRRFSHLSLQFQGNQQPKPIREGHHQPGERPISTSQTELLNWKKTSRGKEKPTSWISELGPDTALSECGK